jgi:prepilin-type N-terminal cleavage/methylation domain-containing protein/prepilin-type processing-associated H-X9-DG protein
MRRAVVRLHERETFVSWNVFYMEKLNENNPLGYISFPKSIFFKRYNNSTITKRKRFYFLNGFTLIELLVVISIIALLLGILMPSLHKARNQARAVICQSHLKQWGTAFAVYLEENNGHLGHFGWTSPGLLSITNEENKKIRYCPMAVRPGNKPYPDGDFLDSYTNGSKYHLNYTLHNMGLGIGSAFEAWQHGPRSASYGPSIVLKFTEFWPKNSSDNGLVVHTLNRQSNIPVFLDSASEWSILIWEGQKPSATEEDEIGCVINRHDGGVNCLFLDSSVRKVGLKELWTLKWHPEFNTNGPWTKAGGVKPEDWPQWMRGFKDY